MDTEDIIAVLEIGTRKLKCMVCRINNDINLEILGKTSTISSGFHNGVVINLDEATNSIRNCLVDIEKKIKINLKKINIVFEPLEFSCTRLSKYKKIYGSKVEKDDLSFLLKEAKNQIKLNDPKQLIIHIFNYNYTVDSKEFKGIPLGIHADFIKHELSIITVPKNIIKNINQAFINCDIEVEKFISNSFALGSQLLTQTDLKLGASIIDIGYEKSSLVIFNNSALIHSVSIPIGVNHITKDLSRGCSLTLEESENIRNQLGLMEQSEISHKFSNNGSHLSENFFIQTKFRKISISLINNIINSRAIEIFKLIKNEINFSGLSMTSGKNLFLTGGGSNIINFNQFCSDFFKCEIKTIKTTDNIQTSVEESASYSSCLGAIKILKDGFDTEAIAQNPNERGKKFSIISNLFGLRR